MRVTITESAVQTICSESRKAGLFETGGMLIGTLNNLVVLAATGPGPKAERGSGHYSGDPQSDQEGLKSYKEAFQGKVALLGYWHRHPARMSRPSSGDLNQALDLVAEYRVSPDDPFLALISNVDSNQEVRVYAYLLCQAERRFEKVDLEIVADSSPSVRDVLEREQPGIVERDRDFWRDPNFQFFQTPIGKDRIHQEIQQLHVKGFEATVVRRKSTGRLEIVIGLKNRQIRCVPPVEYPLNPPSFYSMDGREIRLRLSVWNSDLWISALAERIFRFEPKPQAEVSPSFWLQEPYDPLGIKKRIKEMFRRERPEQLCLLQLSRRKI